MAKNTAKELYAKLRQLSVDELWQHEVPSFDRANAAERNERVGLIRAVGVVFSESGTAQEKDAARKWLVGLLQDPGEKIRRYAMTALPKLGSGTTEEAALLSLRKTTKTDREIKFLERSLNKIGGIETLHTSGLSPQTQQKVQATVIRETSQSAIDMQAVFPASTGLRLHLRGRKGLEEIMVDELDASTSLAPKFRVLETLPGMAALAAQAPFSLEDLYRLRCFGSVGLVLGFAKEPEAMSKLITSPLAQKLFRTFTKGGIRYRLDFVGKGHQRGAIRELADLVYAKCPEILNDAKSAPWSVDIHASGAVELRPRLIPDPRFTYRVQDVPAASHPPLAAALARLPGRIDNEIVWDPFCGSGLELIESALLGRVEKVYGTDLSEEAISITEKNFAAAGLSASLETHFVCDDFRHFAEKLGPESVSLIITNPPLGRRVPVASIRQLITDLFFSAAKVLRPGGRLVLINPLPEKIQHPALELRDLHTVDLGGFDCRMELYRKRVRD